jgi:hypothetical protein
MFLLNLKTVFTLSFKMDPIYQLYLDARRKDLASYIEENIVDGEKPDKDGHRYVFMATNGSWQTKYLSLYEMLHDKYIARYCAKLLLEDYIDKYETEISGLKSSDLTEPEIRQQLYEKISFSKIVTVTVSSQLIGVALRNLIREDDRYQFLRNPEEPNPLKSSPTLLRLSSYYSFAEEKQFREIVSADKVIVVNDVISTGKLVYSLSKKIKKRDASLHAVFCIADTRVPKEDPPADGEGRPEMAQSEYIYGDLDKAGKIFSLLDCYGRGNEIRKYKRPYTGNTKVKRVNPLLNTIVELETKHSEEKRILFPDPASFLKASYIKEANFKVGHFRQNLSHNGYLTDMHNLFSTEGENARGRELIFAIKARLDNFFEDQSPAIDVLDAMQKNIHWLRTSDEKMPSLEKLSAALQEFTSAYKDSKEGETSNYSPDYIFYPPFSGIEQLDEKLLHECFGTPIENVICLQRFDTSKGWRFPFPAKWYNHLTQDKSILILDSGSLTGESMVQLVDSVSFLDVREITVLCAITRIEDFYREFYSRIKSIKVKKLKRACSGSGENEQHIVPLQILFGINLTIPVYPSRVSCPFCEELTLLRHYEERAKRTHPSEWTKRYLAARQEELKEVNLEKLEKYELPSYLPKLKSGEEFNSVDVLLIRDRLGKVDSYRFYKDYFDDFDNLKSSIDIQGLYHRGNIFRIELILIAILHEPLLVRTLTDLLGDIRDFCQEVIRDLLFDKNKSYYRSQLLYDWSPYSLIRLYVIFMPQGMKEVSKWQQIFQFASSDEQALSYLSFLLWEGFLGESRLLNNGDSVNVISYFSDRLDDEKGGLDSIFKDNRFRKIIKAITNKYAFTPIETLHDAYFNLRKFFFSQTSSNTHNELVAAISRFKIKVENIQKVKEDIPDILSNVEEINNFLREGIMDNLIYIGEKTELKKTHELSYQTLFGNGGVFQELKKLMQEFDSLLEEKTRIQAEDDFERLATAYAHLDCFYLSFLIESSTFYKYCRGYKADFIGAINHVLSGNELLQKQLNGAKELFVCGILIRFGRGGDWNDALLQELKRQTGDNILYLAIHQSFLEKGIQEILMNSIKHSNLDRINIDIKIEKAADSTTIKFVQDEQAETSFRPEEINLIFAAFCGDDGVRFYNEGGENYTVELIFNTESLNYS